MNANQLTSIGRASGLLGATPMELREKAKALSLKPALVVDGVELYSADDLERLAEAARPTSSKAADGVSTHASVPVLQLRSVAPPNPSASAPGSTPAPAD